MGMKKEYDPAVTGYSMGEVGGKAFIKKLLSWLSGRIRRSNMSHEQTG